MNILEKIILDKKEEIKILKREFNFSGLKLKNKKPSLFLEGLNKNPIGFIAEIKRKSPSAGILRNSINISEVVSKYEANGASIISCLIDKKYFGANENDFNEVFETHLYQFYIKNSLSMNGKFNMPIILEHQEY